MSRWMFLGSLVVLTASLAVASDNTGLRPIGGSSNSSSPRQLLSLGSRVVFFADSEEHPISLFGSDGSAAGTVRLSDTRFDLNYVAAGGGIVYLLERTDHGSRIWSSDGTPGGTRPLTARYLTMEVPVPVLVGPHAQRLYFIAIENDRTSVLWTSDGTPEGTVRLGQKLLVKSLFWFQGKVFFAGGTTASGLWKAGTTAGSLQLVKQTDSEFRQVPFGFQIVQDRLTFFTYSPDGLFLWVSDGTAAGTQRVKRVGSTVQAEFTTLQESVVHLQRLFFVTRQTGEVKGSLWVSNGTAASTVKIGERNVHYISTPAKYISAIPHPAKALLFPSVDEAHGLELWSTRGTGPSSKLLKDFCLGTCSYLPSPHVVFKGRAYMLANTAGQGLELWWTNGTAAGTRILADICPGSCSGTGVVLAVLGDRLFLRATDGTTAHQLWISDGLDQLSKVADLEASPNGAALAGSLLLFPGFSEATGHELWRTDGTAQGTSLVLDLY